MQSNKLDIERAGSQTGMAARTTAINTTNPKGLPMRTKEICLKASIRPYHLITPLLLAFFAVLPIALAVTPPPDGGYPNENTAEGEDALFSLTTGSDNTAIGFDALYSNTTGDLNTAVGSNALSSNSTGFLNTALGWDALFSNVDGASNVAIGVQALEANTTGSFNIAIG